MVEFWTRQAIVTIVVKLIINYIDLEVIALLVDLMKNLILLGQKYNPTFQS